ncbi:MAG: hypothetical protein PVF73_09360 [Bacteroidales bacterium]|jgi:hypothetical protein
MERYFINLMLLFVLSLNINQVFCQNRRADEENFKEGEYFFNREEYEDAVLYYLKLVAADSLNAHYNFKVGECYLNIPGKEQMAIPYFERAIKKIVAKNKYKKRSPEEVNAPLHAYFYLGNAYRIDNQLDKALESYEKFIDSPLFWGNYNQNVVEKEIKSCERAKIIQDASIAYEKINLGEAINSAFAEERPVVSGDGKTLVYIRRLKFYDAVFYSVLEDQGWRKAMNINPEILSDGNFYPTGLSYDGTKLLLVKEESGSEDIYISHLEGGVWSKAEPLDDINSSSSDIHASFNKKGDAIYLTSDRSKSRGGYDIFYSKLISNGTWSKPKNLGKNINSEFNEQGAYLYPAPEVLFFSSEGHYNMGGYDIFYSKSNGKKWAVPLNIGYPINDTRDNLYYCPADDLRAAYYAIEEEEGYGSSDIFLIKISDDSVLNFEEQ